MDAVAPARVEEFVRDVACTYHDRARPREGE